MSNNQSLRNWVIIIAILLVSGLLTVIWPTMAGAIGGGSAAPVVPTEVEIIHLNLPTGDTMNLVAWQAMLILAAVVIGLVIAVGVGISILNRLLSSLVTNTAGNEDVQASLANLGAQEKAHLKEMREGRTTDPIPSHQMPRWSRLANGLIIMMFVLFFTMLVNSTFYPMGQVVKDGGLVSTTSRFLWGAVILTLAYFGWRMLPRRAAAPDQVDDNTIPWDFLVVLFMGLLVVGLGIGLAVYLNVPA